ncbi:MAG: T9SS type A sorting domain-containing protein [Sphingomonadales bacterium]|nr:T9SS type A sorting domain-containing protein [Sphingomonadales bacterium]
MQNTLRHLAALLFLILFSPAVNAQLSLNTADTLYAWGPVSTTEIVAYSGVRNNSVNPGNFRWVRTANAQVTGWLASICDLNTCYLPNTDSADFTLNGRAISNIDCHLYPNQALGSGTVVVRIFEVSNRTNAVTVVYRFSTHSAGFSEASPLRLTAFPNPTQDWVTVDVDVPSTQTLSAALRDLQGRTIQPITLMPGRNQLDLGTLPKGCYTLSITDRCYPVHLRILRQ